MCYYVNVFNKIKEYNLYSTDIINIIIAVGVYVYYKLNSY